jgi:hypothetical protein
LYSGTGSNLASFIASANTLQTVLFAESYGVSAASADNAAALNSFFAALIANNARGEIAAGQYAIKSPLVITGPTSLLTPPNGNGPAQGACIMLNGVAGPTSAANNNGNSSSGTVIYWAGTAYAGDMVTMTGVQTGSMQGIVFDGVSLVHNVFTATGVANDYWNPQNWLFTNVRFNRAGAGYCGTRLDNGNNANNTNFIFLNCCWMGIAGYGLGQFGYNNINTQVIGASINGYNYTVGTTNLAGIYAQSGTMIVDGCAFFGHSVADIQIFGGCNIDIRKMWTQNSYQAINIAYFSSPFYTSVRGLDSSSCPFAFYHSGGLATPPANNALQYAHIVNQSPGENLTLQDVHLEDPFTGAQGQYTGYILAQNQGWNSGQTPWTFISVSSEYWTGNGTGQTKVTTGFYGAYTGGTTPTPFQVLGIQPVIYELTTTTGQTISPTSDVSNVVLRATGTLATQTVKAPPRPFQGQVFTVTCNQTITTLTLSADATVNAGATVGGATSITLSAHNPITLFWDFATNQWN